MKMERSPIQRVICSYLTTANTPRTLESLQCSKVEDDDRMWVKMRVVDFTNEFKSLPFFSINTL